MAAEPVPHRSVRIQDLDVADEIPAFNPVAHPGLAIDQEPPVRGKIGTLAVGVGQSIKKGEKLLSIEAMKRLPRI